MPIKRGSPRVSRRTTHRTASHTVKRKHKVSRPKPRVVRRPPPVKKNKGFSFGIPQAHAMPAPLALGKVAGKVVLKNLVQTGTHANLRPGKNIKSVTYANQLMGSDGKINLSTATSKVSESSPLPNIISHIPFPIAKHPVQI